MELYYLEAPKTVVLIPDENKGNQTNVDLLIKELEELEELLVTNCKDIPIGRRDIHTKIITESPKWYGKRIIYAENVNIQPQNTFLVKDLELGTWLRTKQ